MADATAGTKPRRRVPLGAIGAGAVGLVLGASAVALWASPGGVGGGDRGRIENVVHAYLIDNPEVLEEASQALRSKRMGQAVQSNRAAFETPFAGAWAGAANGDVVMVEFFDYACGFCRASNPVIDRLLREDPKLKVVWREWPVLGPDSEAAAEISLAAAAAGKYRVFHDALFAAGRPAPGAVQAALAKAGVSAQQVAAMRGSPAARSELAKNFQLARAINASGTPTWVIGGKVLEGAVGYDALKAAIADARARS